MFTLVVYTGKRLQPDELYPYSKDLMAFSQLVSPVALSELPEEIIAVCTPLCIEKCQGWLEGHSDQEFSKYLLRGMREGFRIGFNYAGNSCTSAKNNM